MVVVVPAAAAAAAAATAAAAAVVVVFLLFVFSAGFRYTTSLPVVWKSTNGYGTNGGRHYFRSWPWMAQSITNHY